MRSVRGPRSALQVSNLEAFNLTGCFWEYSSNRQRCSKPTLFIRASKPGNIDRLGGSEFSGIRAFVQDFLTSQRLIGIRGSPEFQCRIAKLELSQLESLARESYKRSQMCTGANQSTHSRCSSIWHAKIILIICRIPRGSKCRGSCCSIVGSASAVVACESFEIRRLGMSLMECWGSTLRV